MALPGGLMVLMLLMLVNAPVVMEAVRASCHLFVSAVMPGLFPYLTVTLLLVSRLPGRVPDGLMMVLGWCGGSPTGARLLAQCPGLEEKRMRRLAVSCATMSPMFLLGTVPAWLGSTGAGICLLVAVIGGGYMAGLAAGIGVQRRAPLRDDRRTDRPDVRAAPARMTFGDAVEASSRTMLLVCGTMAMLRAAAELCTACLEPYPQLSALCLTLRTALEVTCGAEQLALMPWPLAWKTAVIAGATGFGGMAILLQNRAVLPAGVISLPRQAALQVLHGVYSFVIALGLGLMMGL